MRPWLSSTLGAPEAEAPPAWRSAAQRAAVARVRVEAQLAERLGAPSPAPAPPKGVYLHGSVGSGKSLLLDLLSSTVADQGTVSFHRRLHFNAGMLELHSRMHAIESQRAADEALQMELYASAVLEQRRRDAQRAAKQQGEQGGAAAAEQGDAAGWQEVLRLDPLAQRSKRSKMARMAFRRIMRDMLSRTAAEHTEALATTNAPILRHAARAMIRDVDTMALLRGTAASSTTTSGSGSSGADVAAGGQAGVECAGTGEAAVEHGSGGRISALLCFDELQISDVFSAAALKGLLEALHAEGCVVVATSNRAPSELDRHGLNEVMFDHFISSLHAACDVVPLNAEEDYRRLLAAAAPPLRPLPSSGASAGDGSAAAAAAAAAPLHPHASYFYPLGGPAEAALEAQWAALAAPSAAAAASSSGSAELQVMFGRQLRVERAAGGAAWCSFEELCARPLGAADYMALARSFHTIFLGGIPSFSMQVRDQARRFITLIDELYNHRTRLVCSAATAPDQLFAGAGTGEEPIIDLESLQFETAVEGSRLRRNLMADGSVAPVAASATAAAAAARTLGGEEERLAFARAVSRLYEMQTPLYIGSRPRGQ
ncbi:lactation elevated 1 isoform X1 [Micractinium conductrix]|uniref:Lactation elevated 1 isoform X1 n=1 Tax=Micractinium conductrix TaxID=554055 RepID=A0A2P6V8M1_9CHLO|nr:lactation elevated 1 isoform X1 [Micractinium conductrix]|eukprot:PSC70423.1 lactation elevated 1 isoform X1 [Micractinium conductrix]